MFTYVENFQVVDRMAGGGPAAIAAADIGGVESRSVARCVDEQSIHAAATPCEYEPPLGGCQ